MNSDSFDWAALPLILLASLCAYLSVRGMGSPERSDRRRGAPSWAAIGVLSFGSAILLVTT